MGSFSKLLPYTCYELGHCWHHSCSFTSFEICIIAFIESCKIYGVVYLLTGLINARKISIEYGRKILKDYLTSVCFLTVNAFGYIGSFCVLRSILRHVNFLTASFLPGFIASFMAIFVERQERRSLLAIYVTNVASECLWNSAVGCGYVKPIPHGEILIFAGAMAVLGYSFRSSSPPSRLVNSILQLFLGRGESGMMIASRQVTHPILSEQLNPKPQPWPMKLLSVFTFHHPLCPHKGGCLPHFFRGTCCAGRWWHGKDDPSHGAVAGVLSALSMYFYSAPSLALYMMWKVLESLYEKGCDDGYLPRIPKSVEILYSLSTGYLFHTAVMEKQYMKPSYWRFLKSLTWNRLSMYNRHLLDCYGLNSSQDFHNYWPDYDLDQISDAVKQMLPQHIAETSL